MALLAAGGFAQTTPAPTQWAKYPAVNPPVATPGPPPALPTAGGPGSRVVVFTKPAGDIRPVQNTEPKKDEPKKDEPKKDEPKKPDGPVTPPTPPKEDATPGGRDAGNPFRLRSDDELARDVTDEINRNNERAHKKAVADFREKVRKGDPDTDPDKPPTPPKKLTAKDVELLARETPAVMPPTKDGYAPAQVVLEPGYVVHRRLFFEDKNSERHGWDIGAVQPLLSTAYFVKDVALFPAHVASNFWERYDTSAGKCPPGSPVAYYLYPPQITLKGGLIGAGALAGVFVLIP